MKDPRPLVGLAMFLASPILLAQDREAPQPSFHLEVQAQLADWREQHGTSWQADRNAGGYVDFLYGGSATPAFEPRSDKDFFSIARLFAEESFVLHGIESVTLVEERVTLLPLGLIGTTDKMTVRFRQEVRGVPVLDGRVNVLTDLAGRLLSIQTTALPNVANFSTRALIDSERATQTAVTAFMASVGAAPTSISEATLGIAGVDRGDSRSTHLVYEIDVQWIEEGFEPKGTTYRVDAHTGQVVDQRSSVHHFDVGGTVSVLATPGTLPDIASNPEVSKLAQYIRVQSSAGTINADANGNFNFPGVNGPLTCTFTFVGPYANVVNSAGASYSLAVPLTGTSNNVLLNPAAIGTITAQANCYTELVRLRDWIRSVNPADGIADFPALANTAVSGSCNAFFNGSSINFYNDNGTCVNTAYSTVIAHEMGHWLNVLYGTNNGSDGMGEGNADVFAMYLYDDPIVGELFRYNGSFIRTGTNTRQFCGDCCGGCYGGVHADGEVWMGAAWKVRTRLKNTHGAQAGGDIANALFLGWMNSFNQTQIRSVIETQWLTLDDDDGNITNGTPNFQDIDQGFRQQGFPGFDLPVFAWTNVTVLPDTQNEFGPYAVNANISPNLAPALTSASLRYRVNNGPYFNVPMSPQGGTQYLGLIPGVPAPAKVQYYLTAEDSLGNDETFPLSGTLDPFAFFVGVVNVLYSNNFEGADDEGWTHGTFGNTSNSHDDFQRGFVFGKAGDPNQAASGTRVWGNDLGATGWNGFYQGNQHNYLRSPAIPTDGASITLLRFKRWLTVMGSTQDQAILKVNGQTIFVNNSTEMADTSWIDQEFDISSIASGAPSIQLEYSLNTSNSTHRGGWNIDDVEIVTIGSVVNCPAPINYGTAKVNSLGWPPSLSYVGSTSATANDFSITMALGIPNQPGLLYWGTASASVPFFGGLRLVASPVIREAIFTMNGSGFSSVPIQVTPAMVGTTRYYQKWYRDPADPQSVGLSDGLQVFFCD